MTMLTSQNTERALLIITCNYVFCGTALCTGMFTCECGGISIYLFYCTFFHQTLQFWRADNRTFYTRGLKPLLNYMYMYCHEEHRNVLLIYSELPLLQTPLESKKAGIYFSQTSVNYFCQGFSCRLYYWGVRNNKVSTRRELTVSEL